MNHRLSRHHSLSQFHLQMNCLKVNYKVEKVYIKKRPSFDSRFLIFKTFEDVVKKLITQMDGVIR